MTDSLAPALPPGYAIGAMTDAEIETLGQWAAEEGWNPGRADLAIARACDPDAFIALRQPDGALTGGTLAGGGAVFSHGGRFGFMGLFIMRRDLRGAGLGAALWRHRRDRMIARLEPGAAIGMDGVFDMVKFYERGGFRFAHRDLRFEGIAPDFGKPDHIGNPDPDARSSGAIALSALDFKAIDQFDRGFFPAPRPEFLRRWIAQPGAHALALVEDGRIAAIGVARPCREGFKIGPAFLARPELGERLLAALMAKIAGQKVQIDIPEPNEAGLALAARFGLRQSFGCARLYYGRAPELPLERILGVTSFEFG